MDMVKTVPQRTDPEDNNIKKVNYNGIDLVKFIFAFSPCIVHMGMFGNNPSGIYESIAFWLSNYFSRLLVPYFFICTGFFLFRKMKDFEINWEVVKKYNFGLLRVLGTWYIILFFGGRGHLWYMGGTVTAVIILSALFQRKVNLRWLIILAGCFYIIGLMGDSYYGITMKLFGDTPVKGIFTTYFSLFGTTQTGLFTGVPYVLIGALFAQGKIKINKWLSAVCLMISLILMAVEVYTLKTHNIPKDYNMLLFALPTVVFLFSVAFQLKLKDRPVYRKLRAVALLIYFSHLLVHHVVMLLMEVVNKFTGVNLIPYAFFVSVPIITGLAFLIEYMSHKKRFEWLRYLYS